jgi:hypothetical protein
MIRTYLELIQHSNFEDRYHYLALRGEVGSATFGFDRWLNQQFYTSRQWRNLRQHIIVRDDGCDLGVPEYEILDRPIIHHMNPLTVDDIVHGTDEALDPEYLILVSHRTHNAIHYGDESLLPKPVVSRRPGDTQLWTRRSR